MELPVAVEIFQRNKEKSSDVSLIPAAEPEQHKVTVLPTRQEYIAEQPERVVQVLLCHFVFCLAPQKIRSVSVTSITKCNVMKANLIFHMLNETEAGRCFARLFLQIRILFRGQLSGTGTCHFLPLGEACPDYQISYLRIQVSAYFGLISP